MGCYNIKIKKLNDNAVIPTRGSEFAAGYDLHACIDSPVTILPHTTKKIGTGLAMELPVGYFGAIFARSGLATKQNLRPGTCVSVIDADYRGEWFIPIHNDSNIKKTINPSERIAQVVLMPFYEMKFEKVQELNNTIRGTGGFGSTGGM